MIGKLSRKAEVLSKRVGALNGFKFSQAVTINSVTYVEQEQEEELEFSQEDYEAYKATLPQFSNVTYQLFLTKVNAAQQKTLQR